MSIQQIQQIEKNFFSSLHSDFDKMLYNLSNIENQSKNIDQTDFVDFCELNKEILHIQNLILKINTNLIKKKDKSTHFNKLTQKEIETLENFDNDRKCINAFLPYMMAYRMLLDN